jgi:hypothetical protein
MDTPRIEPGTLDLSPRLPSNPALRTEVVEARAVCDTLGHPPGCFNPWTDTTFCRCGFVQYAGDVAPPPVQRVIPRVGKFDNAPWAWV